MNGDNDDKNNIQHDKWGYPINTSSNLCISYINSYYHQVLSYGRERSVILEASKSDPDCVLANVLSAHFLSSNNPSLASSFLNLASSQLDRATSYEKAVFDAVSCLMAKNRDDDEAIELHFKLLKEFPRDLVSLKRAQLVCFYLGRPDISLKFVEQVLPHNQNESYIHGMHAFPLLELGRMDDAEEAARKGLEINKQDLWSQHCLCHVLQHCCCFKEAVEFMEACSFSWNSSSSFMYTHNWWHVAVCYLEGHSPLNKVIDIYDHHIWNELQRSDAACEEVYINALGLLLRLYVREKVDVIADQLKIIANCLMDQSTWHREWLLDLLALWALSTTKETHRAEELLKSMKSRILSMNEKRQQYMHKGILLAEALYEYGKGNNGRVFELLGPDFDANDYKMVGASDEQLDVFNEVWYTVLLNTGHSSMVVEEIKKRIKAREGVPFLWQLLEKGFSAIGSKEATVAAEKAKALETSYFKEEQTNLAV